MELIGIILIFVLVAVAKCDQVMEDTTANVSEILDTLQGEKPTIETDMKAKKEKIEGVKNKPEMKGQPQLDGEEMETMQEKVLPAENEQKIVDGGERDSRMYTESDTDLTTDDIENILRNLGFPDDKKHTPQSRGVIGEDIRSDDSDEDDFYVLSFAPNKGPLLGLGKQLFAIDHANEARYKNSWKRYFRKMFRKLRRSTRKYKRKGSIKSSDLTVENIIKKIVKKKEEEQGFFYG